jgi:hypothetical protein
MISYIEDPLSKTIANKSNHFTQNTLNKKININQILSSMMATGVGLAAASGASPGRRSQVQTGAAEACCGVDRGGPASSGADCRRGAQQEQGRVKLLPRSGPGRRLVEQCRRPASTAAAVWSWPLLRREREQEQGAACVKPPLPPASNHRRRMWSGSWPPSRRESEWRGLGRGEEGA